MDLSKLFSDNPVNSIELIGTVASAPVFSHEFDDIKYYSVRLNVRRTPKSSKYDNIHIFINSDDLVVDTTLIDTGARLEIKGYLVQSVLHHMNDLSVVATSVKLTDSPTDENMLYIKGTIYKLFDTKEISNSSKIVKSFIMHHNDYICNKRRNLTALVNCWNNTAKLLDSTYEVGNELVVRGQLESRETITKDDNTSIILHQVAAMTLYSIDSSDSDTSK